MDPQNRTKSVTTTLFGGAYSTCPGRRDNGQRTLAFHCSNTVSSDDAEGLRQISLGIGGIHGVRRAGNSTLRLLVDFVDPEISDADMLATATELFREAERLRPRVSYGVNRRPDPAIAVNSD